MLDSNTCSSVASSSRVIGLAGAVNLAWEDWLNLRKCGIVNSEAASAESLDPERSPLALWLAKTSRENPLPKGDPYDENSPSYWAHLLVRWSNRIDQSS